VTGAGQVDESVDSGVGRNERCVLVEDVSARPAA
jgi:hypothetical protein